MRVFAKHSLSPYVNPAHNPAAVSPRKPVVRDPRLGLITPRRPTFCVDEFNRDFSPIIWIVTLLYLPMTQPAMKKVAIFFCVIVNGTWALIAYLLHKVGVPPRTIVLVLGIGIVLGNLSVYAGVKLAAKVLGRRPSSGF
jgi:hypothetical protein